MYHYVDAATNSAPTKATANVLDSPCLSITAYMSVTAARTF